MRWGGTGRTTEANPEVEEAGHQEDVEDPAGTEAAVTLEAEEDEAAEAGASGPLLNENSLVYFLRKKNCQKTLGHVL